MPNIASGIGAVATQALSNPFYGVNGIKLLAKGKSAADVVKTLVGRRTTAASIASFT